MSLSEVVARYEELKAITNEVSKFMQKNRRSELEMLAFKRPKFICAYTRDGEVLVSKMKGKVWI